jgi:hypothetical protein
MMQPYQCRSDIPLYDVLKIFRFGRKHMACLTRVSSDPSASAASRGGVQVANGSAHGAPGTNTTVAGQQVEEVVGIVTIEDVLEELLQVTGGGGGTGFGVVCVMCVCMVLLG